MGLGFLVGQIYLVSLGNYDPHVKNLRFSGFFYLLSSIELHFKTAGPFYITSFNICYEVVFNPNPKGYIVTSQLFINPPRPTHFPLPSRDFRATKL